MKTQRRQEIMKLMMMILIPTPWITNQHMMITLVKIQLMCVIEVEVEVEIEVKVEVEVEEVEVKVEVNNYYMICYSLSIYSFPFRVMVITFFNDVFIHTYKCMFIIYFV